MIYVPGMIFAYAAPGGVCEFKGAGFNIYFVPDGAATA